MVGGAGYYNKKFFITKPEMRTQRDALHNYAYVKSHVVSWRANAKSIEMTDPLVQSQSSSPGSEQPTHSSQNEPSCPIPTVDPFLASNDRDSLVSASFCVPYM